MTSHLLSNGAYTVLLTPRGTGLSAFEGRALNRWLPDALADRAGFFFYLRDLDTGDVWSATAEPIAAAASEEAIRAQFTARRAYFRRRAYGIETSLEIAVVADAAAELRRLELVNTGRTARRLSVTTWLELVLNAAAADAAHPAFSKLFVQTAFDGARDTLLAWRRPRDPEEAPIWAAHYLSGPALAGSGTPPPGGCAQAHNHHRAGPSSLEYETDRAVFIGRGRSAASPVALASGQPLAHGSGNVLDPGFALRRMLTLEPGEGAHCWAVLAAGQDRAAVERIVDRFRDGADSAEAALAFQGARPATAASAVAALGLPRAWRDRLALDTAAHEVATQPRRRFSRVEPIAAEDRGTAQQEHPAERLLCFNGYGGFSAAGDEYVIRVPITAGEPGLPPLPWINVIANEHAGCLVSESGAGCVWAANSRENRITPWRNDPVSDPPADAVFVRDDDTGEYWSLAPAPAPRRGRYEVRHGFGYTHFTHQDAELAQELCVFVPRAWPARLTRVRLTNRGPRTRRLSLWSYAQLVLGGLETEARGDVCTSYDPAHDALTARNPRRGEYSDRVAFSALRTVPPAATTWCADRASFLGESGELAAPGALREPGGLSGGHGVDPCFSHQCALSISPGETAHAVVVLGDAADAPEAAACLEALGSVAAADAAFADVVQFWRELLGRVRVHTPDPELDLMANGWAAYQTLSCRIWGRSALYQSGGAYGFRDQLQDAAALVYLDPALTRTQLLLHAANQFVEGDVLHWWHPPLGKGIRTRFSDDLLWLPALTAFYLSATGDAALLDEVVGFQRAPLLDPGEDERYLQPEPAAERASYYEHCCRALDRSLASGAHGLPLIGAGDWNDGMNRVGREGHGESVWLGFFLFDTLDRFMAICRARGDHNRASRYQTHLEALGRALNDGGWDGEWYRRAYYDDGTPLGSARNEECRIDAIAQAWAVISGAAPPERAERALDALEQHLVAEDEGIIRLLAPPFDRTNHDPGYIKGYLPGVRENGGQYTHGALWGVRALLELGRKDRGARLLRLLGPVSHGSTKEQVARYRGEPYVIAADICGVAPHVGRVGWTWYTGSAGWFFRVLLENLLGLELRGGDELALRPCIPDDWPGFALQFTSPGGGRCRVEVTRSEDGVTRAVQDGQSLVVRERAVCIPLRDSGEQQVQIALGLDVGPAYRCRLRG